MPKNDYNKVAVEVTVWHGCSLVNFLHISRTRFYSNTSGRLLLEYDKTCDLETIRA